MFYYDSTMLILIPALIISFIAQMQINSAYSKYKVYVKEMAIKVRKFEG